MEISEKTPLELQSLKSAVAEIKRQNKDYNDTCVKKGLIPYPFPSTDVFGNIIPNDAYLPKED